jgi:hypothetical protein
MRLAAIFVGFLAAVSLRAQVVQLTGGSSTLYEASGGLATVYFPDFNLDLGGGIVNGVPALQAAVSRPWRGWDLALGSSAFSATVGSEGLSTSVLGATLSKSSADRQLTFFAGDVQPLLGSAFFRGTPFRLRGGAGVYYRRKLKALTFATLTAASGKELTALGDAGLHQEHLDAGVGGGWFTGRPLLQGRSSYHAVVVGRLNLAASANFLRLGGQEFETLLAAVGVAGFGIYGSKILGVRSGETYGASAHLGPFDLGGNYMAFKGNASVGTSLGERLGRHLVLREYATRSAGRWNESFGGAFTTNHLSVNVSQAVYFTPYGNVPLERSLTVTVHFISPWKSSSVNLASGVDPSGKIRYGIDGGMFLGSGLGGPSRTVTYQNTGKYRIEGTVVDETGQPVSGAAIRLGKDLVFTDNAGTFFLRVKHERAVSLTVVPDEFTNPGRWMMVTAPDHADPGEKVKIVVRRGRRDEKEKSTRALRQRLSLPAGAHLAREISRGEASARWHPHLRAASRVHPLAGPGVRREVSAP